MAKNDKATEVAVKKGNGGPKKEVSSGAAPRVLSPLRAWERDIERMLEDFPFRWPRLRQLDEFRFPRELRIQPPTLDMYEEKNDVVVKVEMPGMAKDDIEITLSDSTLTLKGEKRKEEEIKEKDYYRCEREYGSFLRTVELPAEVKTEGAKAVFKNGVLEVRLRKSAEAKQKKIQLQVHGAS